MPSNRSHSSIMDRPSWTIAATLMLRSIKKVSAPSQTVKQGRLTDSTTVRYSLTPYRQGPMGLVGVLCLGPQTRQPDLEHQWPRDPDRLSWQHAAHRGPLSVRLKDRPLPQLHPVEIQVPEGALSQALSGGVDRRMQTLCPQIGGVRRRTWARRKVLHGSLLIGLDSDDSSV